MTPRACAEQNAIQRDFPNTLGLILPACLIINLRSSSVTMGLSYWVSFCHCCHSFLFVIWLSKNWTMDCSTLCGYSITVIPLWHVSVSNPLNLPSDNDKNAGCLLFYSCAMLLNQSDHSMVLVICTQSWGRAWLISGQQDYRMIQ